MVKKDECNFINSVQLSDDVSDGYSQVKRNRLFRGQGKVLSFNNCAYYVLSNPKDSKVNIFIRTLFLSNLCPYPLAAEIVYYGTPTGDLYKSNCIGSGNTYYPNAKGTGIIYSGAKVNVSGGKSLMTHTLPPYCSYRTLAQGSVLLAPGMNHIVKMESIDGCSYSKCIVGFDWWEEPIECD